ncbi:pyridoxal phosphate-dependent aminotransferase [Thermodesulfobacteriota bacterium]
MSKIKSYLKNVHRTTPSTQSRSEYLRLDMNENPAGLPEGFVREALSEIESGYLASYPEYSTLTKKIAEHNGIDPENICISNGSDGAIKYIFDAYVLPGDKVLLTDPTFAMYPVYCKMFGAEPGFFPYNDDFTFSVDRFVDKISSSFSLVVLVNPNNPTGTAIEPEQIERVVQRCSEHDVLILIDEAYFYFYDKSCIGWVNQFDNLVILRTFSKLCGLASLRLGYAAACSRIIQSLEKVKPSFDVNGVAVILGQKILENPQIIEEQINIINKGKTFLKNELEARGVEYQTGEANFFLIKCPGKVNEISEALREKKILVAGDFKQAFLREYIRVTVGSLECMRLFCDIFFSLSTKLYGA